MSRRTTGHDRGVPLPEGWSGTGRTFRRERGSRRAVVVRMLNPETELIEWAASIMDLDGGRGGVLWQVFTGQDLHEAIHLAEEELVT